MQILEERKKERNDPLLSFQKTGRQHLTEIGSVLEDDFHKIRDRMNKYVKNDSG